MLDAAQDADERGLALFAQAVAVGLAADGALPTGADVHAALRSATAADPEEPPVAAPAGEVEALTDGLGEVASRLGASH